MLEITPTAAERLQAALAEASEAENACIRIVVAASGVELTIDEQREGDATLKHEGNVLVVLDSVAAESLEDRKIDYDQETSRFMFV
jgi:Fe-S cluster assembly iron-binding protein IscA